MTLSLERSLVLHSSGSCQHAGADPVDRHRAVAPHGVAQGRHDLARPTVLEVIHGDRLRASPHQIDAEVIVQVGSDGSHVAHDVDAHVAQMIGRADAR
jgi:hypothetical protein